MSSRIFARDGQIEETVKSVFLVQLKYVSPTCEVWRKLFDGLKDGFLSLHCSQHIERKPIILTLHTT
jgi:hypothetical protein